MRNPLATHTDFRDFKGLIKTNPKLTPSNLDMVLERKGKFLVGEWKRENEQISQGQKILLKSLALQKDFCVLIIYGHTDEEQTVIHKFYFLSPKGTLKLCGTSLDDLKDFVTRWYNYADQSAESTL